MSLTVMSGPGDASRTSLHAHFRPSGSEMSGHSRGGSWVSDNTPIPWSGSSSSNNEAASSSTARPHWRSSSSSHLSHSHPHLVAPTFDLASNSRSASIRSIAMGGVASRSRVSMDALPAEDDSTSDHEDHHSHHTISPTSSSASLPDMADQPPAPPPFPGVGQAALILGGAPVGLGLPSYLGGTGRPDWPVVRDLGADAGESDEDDIDQHEMDTYQASHRAPVDATLRSIPGIVALGDGWASGSQTKQKKRWFRRGKKEDTESVVEDDPLALWSSPSPSGGGATHESPVTQKDDPNAKWWRSRKSLFTSQRALASSTGLSASSSPAAAGENKASSRPVGKGRAWVNRSRLNFGSMVDLSRLQDKRSAPASANATTPTAPISAISAFTPTSATTPVVRTPPKTRHSVGGFLRKAPPHPLDLSHGSKGNAAASRSQPLLVAASSSQPTFFPSPSQEHPLLRMSYARSESHLAGAGSPGIPPRPVVDNGPMPRPPAMSAMPMWRPQGMSPTPLLEVEEEDEEDQDWSQDSPERPALKRTATFGDDEQQQHPAASTPAATAPASTPPVTTTNPPARERVSQAPGLPTVAGSPHEPLRALSSASTTEHTPHQPVSLLGKIKNVLTRGKGRSSGSGNGNGSPSLRSSHGVPESPRSTQSEQPQPTTPTRASLLPPPRSVGHGLRRRSRLWSRRDLSKEQPPPQMPETPDRARAEGDNKGSYRVSQHVAESLINLSPAANHETDPASRRNSTASAMSSGSRRRRRLSSFTPIPSVFRSGNNDESDEGSEKEERRRSVITLRRFSAQSKQRPALGTVFPRPPDTVDQPPSLHWAFPTSYSTPMLHKFGGSTLSLALDISSADNHMGLDDIQEAPTPSHVATDPETLAKQRERALSATIATLTSRQQGGAQRVPDSPPVRLSSPPRGRRHSVPVNIDNLTNSSADSLTLPAVNMVNFPLPPSSPGNTSSPDPDQVEQLRTPGDGVRQYPHQQDLATLVDAGETSDGSTGSGGSAASSHLRKQPSWSTCKTASAAGTSLTPIATPTSFISSNGVAQHDNHHQKQLDAYQTARESYTSLIDNDAAPYMAKALNAPSQPHPIVA